MKRLRRKTIQPVVTVLLCWSLMVANAQGFPGGPIAYAPSFPGGGDYLPGGDGGGGGGGGSWIDDFLGFLEGAGPAVGTLFEAWNLFKDFSVEKFLSFACNTAGTVDGYDNSADSAAAKGYICAIAQALSGFISGDMSLSDIFASACEAATNIDAVDEGQDGNPEDDNLENAKKAACTVSKIAEQIDKLIEDNRLTVEEVANSPLTESIIASLGLGPITREQLQGLAVDLDELINGNKSPQEIAAGAIEITRKGAEIYKENRDTADFLGTTSRESFGPFGEIYEAVNLQERARDTTNRIQAAANTQGSREIVVTQGESEVPRSITEGVTNLGAPYYRSEAATAVSTRSTVQEVVNVMTAYMEQDANQFAYLSQQLTQAAIQQVYTAHTLQIMADTLIAEAAEERRKEQANLEVAAANAINRITGAGKQVTIALGGFTLLDGGAEPLIASIY